MVQVIGHHHEIFLIWAAASEGDLFNTNSMDVSTCSPFSCNWYAAFRSPVMSFEEECPPGKSTDMLLRKTPAEHSPSPGYLSIDWKINQKQQVKAQWETCGRKCKQKAIKRNQCHKHRWNYQCFFSQCHCLVACLIKLMSRILPSKAGFSSELKSQVQGQEVAPQNIIH